MYLRMALSSLSTSESAQVPFLKEVKMKVSFLLKDNGQWRFVERFDSLKSRVEHYIEIVVA